MSQGLQLLGAWNALREEFGPGWYWLAHENRGDIYNYCSLAPHFRHQHKIDIPMFLVVGSPDRVQIGELFREEFNAVIVRPELASWASTWREFYNITKLSDFTPEGPLLLSPIRNPWFNGLSRDGYPWYAGMGEFLGLNSLNFMQIYKFYLRLWAETEPAIPPRRPEKAEAARRLCDEHGIAPGKTVVLFPYAQTHGVRAEAHFAVLASELRRRDWTVLTSVAGDETPVPGTAGVHIPFALLLDVAEIAGWTIAVRSGIDDFVSGVPCRKTTVFHGVDELRASGLDTSNDCRDSFQFTFNFDRQSPEEFTRAVISGVSETGAPRIRGLSRDLVEEAPRTTSFSFVDLQRGVQSPEAMGLCVNDHLGGVSSPMMSRAVRLVDIPSRAHPRWGEFIHTAIGAVFGSASSPRRYFVCRDTSLPNDGFEEISHERLLSGGYDAGWYFHTVIAVQPGRFDGRAG